MSSPCAGLLQHRLHTQEKRLPSWIGTEDLDLLRTECTVLSVVVGDHYHWLAATDVIAEEAPGGQVPLRQARQLAAIEHREVSHLQQWARPAARAEDRKSVV